MSEGPAELIELCYEFECSESIDEIVDVCIFLRNLSEVVDVELHKVISLPKGTPTRQYRLMVVLSSKANISTVQEWLWEYRQYVSDLKIGLYMGSYQKLFSGG